MSANLRRLVAGSLGPALLLLAVACADPESDTAADEVPVWTLIPELRIGSVDDPAYSFTAVQAIEIGADGSIYSLHPLEAEIRRWTPEGLPDGVIGRKGEGPGEFMAPRAFGWHADTLWVMDVRTYAFTYFDSGGRFLARVAPHIDLGTPAVREGGLPPRPVSLLSDGTVYGLTPALSNDVATGALTALSAVRTSFAGEPLDTLAVLPVGRANVLAVLRDGGGTYTDQPFADDRVGVPTEDGSGLIVVDREAPEAGSASGTFRVTRIGLDADTVFSREYPYRPVPIPGERVDAAIDSVGQSLWHFMGERTGTSAGQWRDWTAEAMYVPASYRPVAEVVSGRGGTIWLHLTPPEEGTTEWLVLDGQGEPLARLEIPTGTRVMLADREHVWAVEKDDLDVDYIVRYRVGAP